MPSRSRSSRNSPLVARLFWIFGAAAALLWLLPLLAAPSTPILFPPGHAFQDILVYKGRFALFHTAAFFRPAHFSAFAYPAGAAPPYELFYKTSDPKQTYFALAAIIVAAFLILAYAMFRNAGHSHLIAPLLLLSYPVVFLIERANIELILWALVGLGLLAASRGLRLVAAMLFGLAAAIKLYPIFLLGLFLRRKDDLPAFFLGLLTAIAAMVAAIIYAGPTFPIAYNGFFHGIDRFQDRYVDTMHFVERAFDHCLLTPFKVWSHGEHIHPSHFLTFYYLAAGTLAVLLFLRVRTLPFLNRMLFLVAAMLALPPVSYTYTLVHLLLPLVLLTIALAGTRAPATAMLALALLLFLMLPLNGLSAVTPIPAGPVQSVALLCLLPLTATQPWPATDPDRG